MTERQRRTTSRKTIDQRFDEVTEAIVEQRDYTTSCFEKLRQQMKAEIGGLRAEFRGELHKEIGSVRRDLRSVEGRLTRRLDNHDLAFGAINTRLTRQDQQLDEILSEVKALRPEIPGQCESER